MAIRAIRLGWLDRAPKPEHTEAVMTKATMLALNESAKPHEVIAVSKLHIEYHSRVLSHLHHDDRMEYYERQRQMRAKVGDYVPPSGGPPINVNSNGGPVAVSIFLPSVDPIQDDIIDPADRP